MRIFFHPWQIEGYKQGFMLNYLGWTWTYDWKDTFDLGWCFWMAEDHPIDGQLLEVSKHKPSLGRNPNKYCSRGTIGENGDTTWRQYNT